MHERTGTLRLVRASGYSADQPKTKLAKLRRPAAAAAVAPAAGRAPAAACSSANALGGEGYGVRSRPAQLQNAV